MSRMKRNPDKWIRQAVTDRIDGVIVDGIPIPCIDVNYTGNTQPQFYVAKSTQTKADNQTTKCGWQWDCTILLDLITRYPSTGNIGTRVFLNDIEEKIILLMNNFSINGGFQINERVRLEDSTEMDGNTDTEIYFRQLMRYRIIVTEPFTT